MLLILNITYGVVAYYPCNTNNDCIKELNLCPKTLPKDCQCTIPCVNGECGPMATYSSNLGDEYFIQKAEEYIISHVGEDFYREHYAFYKLKRKIYFDDNVEVFYTISMGKYKLPPRSIAFSCNGKITYVGLYLNNSSKHINESEAISIANSFLREHNINPPNTYKITLDYYALNKKNLVWRIQYFHPTYFLSIDYKTGKILEETVSESYIHMDTTYRITIPLSIFTIGTMATYFALRKLNKRDR